MRNSVPTGAADSRATSPMAAIRLWPARSAFTIMSSASGRPASNFPNRRLRIISTQHSGAAPSNTPAPRAAGSELNFASIR